MKFIAIFAATAALAMPATAIAQDAPAAEANTATVTDAELTQFVDIVMQGQGIQNDTTMSDADKQSAMVTIISESDLGMTRFTEVAQAIDADPALQQRVQAAVMERLGAAG